jgi:hypothetical protein
MTGFKRFLLVALGVAALAVPAGAIAKQGQNHGKGKDKSKKAAYVFKGFYVDDSSLDVRRGNSRVRKGGFIGETVEFDFSNARIVVRDTNGDHKRNLDDVESGDWVIVKTRLPRKDPGSQPFEAKRLIDKTNHPGKSKGKGKGPAKSS